MKKLIASFLAASVVISAALAFTQDKPAAPAAPAAAKPVDEKAVVASQLPAYPLTKCVVCDMALPAGKTVEFVNAGRLYRLCSAECGAEIKKDAAKFTAKVDAAVIAAQKASYPLQVCPVSGEKLGGMGEPVEYVAGTRLVRFCCKSCIKEFEKDSTATMATIDAALIEQQKKTYPLTTCVISGQKIEEGKGVDQLYGVRLVRFCCKDCPKEFAKDPGAAIAKIDAAAKAPKK